MKTVLFWLKFPREEIHNESLLVKLEDCFWTGGKLLSEQMGWYTDVY